MSSAPSPSSPTVAGTSTGAFLDALASAAPTPGGGGAAALMGATGAALIAMVCNLTRGRPGFEAVEADITALLAQAQARRAELLALVDADAVAFNALMAAYRLPRAEDPAARAERSAAIQQGLIGATEAPLACAEAAAAVVALCAPAAQKGNPQVLSDVGVAVLAARAALQSAALNVQINLPQIKDGERAQALRQALEQCLASALPLAEQVHQDVAQRLAG